MLLFGKRDGGSGAVRNDGGFSFGDESDIPGKDGLGLVDE